MSGPQQRARSQNDESSDLPRDRATALSQVAGEVGASDIAADAVALNERLAEGRALEHALGTLASTAGTELVQRAERRGCALLLQRLPHEIDEQHAALVRPVSESEERIQVLRTCVAEAERALNDLGYLLTAEQERLHRVFEEQWKSFLARAIPLAREELLTAFQDLRGHREQVRRQALRLAQDIALRWVDRWLTEAAPAQPAGGREASGAGRSRPPRINSAASRDALRRVTGVPQFGDQNT